IPAGKQTGIAPLGKGEVYRPAPYRRSQTKKRTSLPAEFTQATLDDLFAQATLEVDILPSLPIASIRAARDKKQNKRYTQLGFDSLPELFAIEGATALAPEEADNGTNGDKGAIQRTDRQPDRNRENGFPINLVTSER